MSESVEQIAKTTTNKYECKGDQDANDVREQVRMGELSVRAREQLVFQLKVVRRPVKFP